MTRKTSVAAGTRGVVIALLAFSIAGCSSAGEPDPPGPDTTSVPADGAAGDGDAGAGDVGDPGGTEPDPLPYVEELDGRRLTIESFGTSTPADPEFWEVEAGNEAVYLQVRVENLDAEPWESNMAQFFLFDEDGEEYSSTFFPVEVGGVPDTVTLEVGDSVEGYVPFEVPVGATGLRLEYAVDLSRGAVITVQLT